jgi:uncharacterized protein
MTLSDFLTRFGTTYLLWLALHWYADRRLVAPFRLVGKVRLVSRAFIVASAVLPPVAFAIERLDSRASWAPPLAMLGYATMGLSTSVLLLLLARDLGLLGWGASRFLSRGVRRLRTRSDACARAAPEPNLERRRFLVQSTSAGVLATSAGGFAAGFEGGGGKPRLVEKDVSFPDLPPALDGFRIAQISDAHIGPIQDAAYLADVVGRVNALDVDLVAVTGDLVDGYADRLAPSIASVGALRARHGAWFVTGNHEYYWDADAWVSEVRKLGVNVLRNEHRVIEHDGAKLVLGGVDDHSAPRHAKDGRSDPALAFEGAPADGFRVLLAHQPNSVFKGAPAGARLQLSGHTHGGQFFPATLLIGFFQRYVAGLYRHRDAATGRETQLYVSRGTGSWGPPIRLGAPTEITVLRLRRS